MKLKITVRSTSKVRKGGDDGPSVEVEAVAITSEIGNDGRIYLNWDDGKNIHNIDLKKYIVLILP